MDFLKKVISENFDFLEMDDNLSEPLSHVVFVGQKFRVKKEKRQHALDCKTQMQIRLSFVSTCHETRRHIALIFIALVKWSILEMKWLQSAIMWSTVNVH